MHLNVYWNVDPIVYKKTDEWHNEWQRMTTNDNEWYNEWQRVVQWVKTSDNEWYNEWQRVTILPNFSFSQIREEPTTKHTKENSLNLEEGL